MLDDQKFIAQKDPNDALGTAAKQAEQLLFSDFKYSPPQIELKNVVLAGMGGSALAGDCAKNWLEGRLSVPLEVVRGYTLPAYVGEHSLVVVSSYSGNTEETLAAYADARQKGAQVVVMTTGGRLADLAQEHQVQLLKLPDGYEPRMALLVMLKLVVAVLEQASLVSDSLHELNDAHRLLSESSQEMGKDTPTANNPAKKIAIELMGRAVWVFGGPALASAAYYWKISINEDAKNVASWNSFPEFDHNEIVGWTSHPIQKPFGIVQLQSNLDNPRIAKRWAETNRLLSGQMPAPIEVMAKGQTQIEQLLWAIQLGDFVACYLAILNGVNPVKTPIIDKLKAALAD
jgi:glucose/mannose-6-phosphate isomerase